MGSIGSGAALAADYRVTNATLLGTIDKVGFHTQNGYRRQAVFHVAMSGLQRTAGLSRSRLFA